MVRILRPVPPGARLEFGKRQSDPAFWPDAVKRMTKEALPGELPPDWRLDDLIVDEAQDVKPGWLEVLRIYLHADANVRTFEDPNQNLRGTEAVPPAGLVGYRWLVNCPTPETIARFLGAALLDHPFTCANDLHGLESTALKGVERAGKLHACALHRRVRPTRRGEHEGSAEPRLFPTGAVAPHREPNIENVYKTITWRIHRHMHSYKYKITRGINSCYW